MGKYPYQGRISASTHFEYFPFEVENPESNTRTLIAGLTPGAASWQIEKEVSLLKLAEDVLERPFSTLSSGEQTKVLLATLLRIIKEPNN